MKYIHNLIEKKKTNLDSLKLIAAFSRKRK